MSHCSKQRWQGCATWELTLLITWCDDNQIVPCKNCFGQTDPHRTTTTLSHATTVAISKADNIVPRNDQTFHCCWALRVSITDHKYIKLKLIDLFIKWIVDYKKRQQHTIVCKEQCTLKPSCYWPALWQYHQMVLSSTTTLLNTHDVKSRQRYQAIRTNHVSPLSIAKSKDSKVTVYNDPCLSIDPIEQCHQKNYIVVNHYQ